MQTYDCACACVCVRFDDAFPTPSSSDQMRTLLLLPLRHFLPCGIRQADREHPWLCSPFPRLVRIDAGVPSGISGRGGGGL